MAKLAETYQSLWQAGATLPDVFSFLKRHASADSFEQLSVLLIDQTMRWKSKCGLPAERYFEKCPELFANAEFKLALVYGEFGVRRELGEAPSEDEFKRRFPDLYDSHVKMNAPTKPKEKEDADAQLPFSDYEIKHEIGAGGMGKVFLARQKSTRADVAIKYLKSFGASPIETVSRFLREGRPGRELRHENIVAVRGVGRLPDGGYFLAMEYIDGGSLEQKIKRSGPMAYADVVKAGIDISRAIAHAHASGVIHRDLKPGNILLRRNGTILVTDFGIAQMQGGDYLSTLNPDQIIGTPEYMAPEQIEHRIGPIDPRTDVYGIGGILYAMLVGKPPFSAPTDREILREVISPIRRLRPPRAFRPDVPPALEAVCIKCLGRLPSERYATANDVAAALQKVDLKPPAP